MMNEEEIRTVDFDNLMTIQRKMLEESKRLGQLTVWLIVLTAMLAGTSLATIIVAL